MFTNRTKLSALALGILLTFSSFQHALAADSESVPSYTARNSQQKDYAAVSKGVQINDNAGKAYSAPESWLESQFRVTDGHPESMLPAHDEPAIEHTLGDHPAVIISKKWNRSDYMSRMAVYLHPATIWWYLQDPNAPDHPARGAHPKGVN